MNDITTTPSEPAGKGERYDDARDDEVRLGTWYWIKGKHWSSEKGMDGIEDDSQWLGCVIKIGSNFVEFNGPTFDGSTTTQRILFGEFDENCTLEPDAEAFIAARIAHYQNKSNLLMGKVTETMRRLGVADPTAIEGPSGGDGSSQALVAVSSAIDVDAHKRELIVAKEKTLPDLFAGIKESHAAMAGWMLAPALTMKAQMVPMKETIAKVEKRIYTVELYAGLTESAKHIVKGATPPRDTKLHLMQRRLYMDEECLLSYTGGGIEMKDIHAFDDWLAEPANMDRLLPFERCAAAFRVRRNEKERGAGSAWEAFINLQIAEADKWTYLYVRNGANLWRITCDFEFGEMIFPDATIFDPTQAMMVKMFSNRVDKMMTVMEYEVRAEEHRAAKAAYEAKRAKWLAEHPDEKDCFRAPFGSFYAGFRPEDWRPLDPSNVYYDEGMAEIGEQMARFNRVAVIIQGLFDRSEVLHPHAPVKVWDPVSFGKAIEMVYDATTLTYGEPPDFEAYRARLNATLGENSVVTGQRDFWRRSEAAKLNARNSSGSYGRSSNYTSYTHVTPYGNPGPPMVGPMATWQQRARKASFKWTKSPYADRSSTQITVPDTKLLNVSAYQPGDFKQFYLDPRTRADYLQWAPLMLAAEDWHAGKLSAGSSYSEYSD